MKTLLAFCIGLIMLMSAGDAMYSDEDGNIYTPPEGSEVFITAAPDLSSDPIIGTTNDDYILMIEPWLAGGTHTLMQDLLIGEDLCQLQIWDPMYPPKILDPGDDLGDDTMNIQVGTSPKSWEEAVQNMLADEDFPTGEEGTVDIWMGFDPGVPYYLPAATGDPVWAFS